MTWKQIKGLEQAGFYDRKVSVSSTAAIRPTRRDRHHHVFARASGFEVRPTKQLLDDAASLTQEQMPGSGAGSPTLIEMSLETERLREHVIGRKASVGGDRDP